MSDFFEETFAELDKYYPGSRRKRKEAPEPKPKDTSWESGFFTKVLPNGRQVQMYTLGSVAKALNRSTKTLRAWIEQGKLPASPYRMPDTTGVNGQVYAGRRLYSKAMVEALVDIFSRYRLSDVDRVEWTTHRNLTKEIAEAWETIRAEEMQIDN